MIGGRNFGPLWAIQVLSEGLGHFGSLWATLGHFGPLWATLGHFGCLGHFGPLWATLGHFGPKFRPPIIALKILKVHFFVDTL